jgi:hypothetical protein
MTKAYDNSLLARNINVSGVNTSVTGLLIASSGNFIQSLQVNNVNVSVSGHTHEVSQITDFNTSVSGLLPVTNIVSGSGITVSSSGGSFTINSTSSGDSIPVNVTNSSNLYLWSNFR